MKKNFTLWIWTQDPCLSSKYLVSGPPKQDTIVPHKSILVNYQGLADHLLVWQICSVNLNLLINSFVGYLCSRLAGPMSKYLILGYRVRILSEKFYIFSCWHPCETRFKSGFHSSFWDFICGIWNWGRASSFWNHVIQISIARIWSVIVY